MSARTPFWTPSRIEFLRDLGVVAIVPSILALILVGLIWSTGGFSVTPPMLGVLLGGSAFLALGVGLVGEFRGLRRRIRYPASDSPPPASGWSWAQVAGFLFAAIGTGGLGGLLFSYFEGFGGGPSGYSTAFLTTYGGMAALGWYLLVKAELAPRRRPIQRRVAPRL
jgi:hypothetical protein